MKTKIQIGHMYLDTTNHELVFVEEIIEDSDPEFIRYYYLRAPHIRMANSVWHATRTWRKPRKENEV